MAKPTVYGPTYSAYTRTARLALEEKGVAYDLVDVAMMEGATRLRGTLAAILSPSCRPSLTKVCRCMKPVRSLAMSIALFLVLPSNPRMPRHWPASTR